MTLFCAVEVQVLLRQIAQSPVFTKIFLLAVGREAARVMDFCCWLTPSQREAHNWIFSICNSLSLKGEPVVGIPGFAYTMFF